MLLQFSIFSFGQAPTKPLLIDADSLLQAKIREAVGKPFPSFVAANEQCSITNETLKGKVVLVNFWFEGCHPCLSEFSALNELAEKLKGHKDFEFVSFTWDNAETIQRVKEKYQLQFKVFYSKECSRLNLNMGYPASIVLDRQGTIKYLHCGGSLDKEKAKEFVMMTLLRQIQKEL
jgi:thiol-disulfide isomerase/thioredoxin